MTAPKSPYKALHAASLADPETFWLDAAGAIDWDSPRAFDAGQGVLSTGGMEAVLGSHPDVAECAAIGIRDRLEGG